MKLSTFLALPGQSATEVARQCSVAVSTITRVAKGQKSPSLKLIGQIRQATNGAVTANDFLPPFIEKPAPAACTASRAREALPRSKAAAMMEATGE